MATVSHLPLRTQMMVATVAVSFALTAASLWFVRHAIATEVERQTAEAVRGSVRAFNRIEEQQVVQLSKTVAMLSELPTLKAVLNTQDAPTVQDATAQFLDLSGSDAIVFADSSGRLLGARANGPGLAKDAAAQLIAKLLAKEEYTGWWQNGTELYRYVARPIAVGSGRDSRTVGVMVLARRTTDAMAQDIGRVSGTDVALVAGSSLVASTFRDRDRKQLADLFGRGLLAGEGARPVYVGARPYEVSTVALETASPIRALLLFPLDRTYSFLARLTRIIIVLGLVAVILGAVLVTWLAGAITRPLENLVDGAQALAAGNYSYAIQPRGSAELVELGTSFISMREQLLDLQRRQLEAERMAALGRAASSISHDLRHHLAALVANAEFLRDANELGYNRDEIYREVQQATEQMTGLIDSLIEVARDRSTLIREPAELASVIRTAADAVRGRPEFRDSSIVIEGKGSATTALIDPRKLQRAFLNLLLNACEATSPASRRISVQIEADGGDLLCRVSDNGRGIPDSIRATLFEPFVSEGKNNGTGLGLAIAKKIIQDHEGAIEVEKTSAAGTTFLIRLPRAAATAPVGTAHSSPA